MVTEHFAKPNLSVVLEKWWFLGCAGWDRTFMCSVFTITRPRWPEFWLFTSINGYRAGWGCSGLFSVCGWFEWPSSLVDGFYDHEPSWSCILWLRNCLRLRSVGCRPMLFTWWNTYLRMTDDPDLVWIAVVAPITQIYPLCRKSFRRLRWLQTFAWVGKFSWNIKWTGIKSVVQYGICPDITFGLLTILLGFWLNICSCWLDVMYQPRSSLGVTRINLGLMMMPTCFWPQAAGSSLVDPWSLSGLLGRVWRCRLRANETYSEAKCQITDRKMDVLMNVHSPHKWSSTLKSVVFGIVSERLTMMKIILYISLSLSLALPTFFFNNNGRNWASSTCLHHGQAATEGLVLWTERRLGYVLVTGPSTVNNM